MRRNLLHIWYRELSYEIREIVVIWNEIEKYWVNMIWENIWDPVAKWEKIPTWIKNILKRALNKDEVYAYSPTKWLDKTREYLARKNWKILKKI